MARIPMVTRTIITTKVTVLCLDIQSGEPCNKTITVPRTYKDDPSLMKVVRPMIETEALKAVHVVDKQEIETLYGMTEQEFIEKATLLPPRKNTETEETKKDTNN